MRSNSHYPNHHTSTKPRTRSTKHISARLACDPPSPHSHHNSPTPHHTKTPRKLHSALAVVGTVLVLVWTIHSRGGLAWEATNKTLIFNWIYGFIVFFYPGGSPGLRSESVPWHVAFGLFVYGLAVANAANWFLEKLTFLESSGVSKFGSEAYLVNFTAITTILYGVFVIVSSIHAQGDPAPADEYSYSAI
ncbi:Transmembrane ascorbate ferrireductase 1-like protein [Drosera capensis]